jgi:osmotically-inducible protein OsmY
MKSDFELQHDVLAELAWEPSVNATQIGVEVKDGVVTLEGHVESFTEKSHAERAAKRVMGVTALAIKIEVRLPGPCQREDIDISRTAANIVNLMPELSKDQITVVVENGWVTLSGKVEWNYQRHMAEEAIYHLMGVCGLSNQITIEPNVPMSTLKGDIEAALLRRDLMGADGVKVEAHGADITLSGHVHSWPEREQACHAAWSTPGVRVVVDKINVTP